MSASPSPSSIPAPPPPVQRRRPLGHFLFVGEQRSNLAKTRGWTWTDGRVAAKTLHDALQALGIQPWTCDFANVYLDDGSPNETLFSQLAEHQTATETVIALGHIAARELRKRGVAHRQMVHPAARGSIRKRERYQAHVAAVLGGAS
jgi:hypothetical protein